MTKLSVRPLLAAVLIGALAGTPVVPVRAQEPANAPQPQAAAQGGVPISLGVSQYDYSRAPRAFPNLINPYRMQNVAPGVLANSPRLEQLIHDGKMELSLQDAIALALENSMDIVVQRYSPWIAEVSQLKTDAGGISYGTPGSIAVESLANVPLLPYDPFVSQPISCADVTTPINNPFISGTAGTGASVNTHQAAGLVSHDATYNTSYQQYFVYGTSFNVSWNNTRASSTAANFFNPYVQSSLTVSITQPLLAGAGSFVNRRNILIAENNRRIADLSFAQQAITTTTLTINAYWELAYARENVKVQQQAVTVADKLYNDNKKQLEIGTMAPLDVTRAESELATDRTNLIVAQTAQLQQQQVLRNAISKDPMAPNVANVEIIPTDKPTPPAIIEAANFEDAVKEAFANRPDLATQDLNVKNAEIDTKANKNALLPVATANARYGAVGLAGNSPIVTSTTVAGNPIVDSTGIPVTVLGAGGTPVAIFEPTTAATQTGTRNSGFGDAQSQIFHNEFPDYLLSLNVTIPIRNRVAQADYQRALLR